MSNLRYFEDLLTLLHLLHNLFKLRSFLKLAVVPKPFVGLVLRQPDGISQLLDILRFQVLSHIFAKEFL